MNEQLLTSENEILSFQENQSSERVGLELHTTPELEMFSGDIAEVISLIEEDRPVKLSELNRLKDAFKRLVAADEYRLPIKAAERFRDAQEHFEWTGQMPLMFAQTYLEVGLPELSSACLLKIATVYKKNHSFAWYIDWPDIENRILSMVEGYLLLNQPADAKQAADILEGEMHGKAYQSLARYLSSHEELDNAVDLASEVRRDHFTYSLVNEGILDGLLEAGAYEEAFAYAEGTGGDEQKVQVYEALAASLYAAGNMKGAHGALQSAKAILDRVNPDIQVTDYAKLSATIALLGDSEGALVHIKKWGLDSNEADSLREVAKIQKKQGDEKGYASTIQEAIDSAYRVSDEWRLNSRDKYIFLADIARVQYDLGETKEAISTLRNAYDHLIQNLEADNRFDRSHIESLPYLALTQAEVGDLEGAEMSFWQLDNEEERIRIAQLIVKQYLKDANYDELLRVLGEFGRVSDRIDRILWVEAASYWAEKGDDIRLDTAIEAINFISSGPEKEQALGQVYASRACAAIKELATHPDKDEVIRKLCNITKLIRS